eukprot:TRINITY_DN1300_c0_g1_i2.p1 TRINITY_DN1300_c0_g1~~TRINITY_DN1300_c0_g1_i2.p1  ORF type:complete len:106 (-),score=30.48 TRINITY_DN1300_c0_g1_i2:132-449(-)
MEDAWHQEKAILEDQLKAVDEFPMDNPYIVSMRQQLVAELEENENQLDKCHNPQEAKRRQFMLDMHTTFVQGLESLVPLLKLKCPDADDKAWKNMRRRGQTAPQS